MPIIMLILYMLNWLDTYNIDSVYMYRYVSLQVVMGIMVMYERCKPIIDSLHTAKQGQMPYLSISKMRFFVFF